MVDISFKIDGKSVRPDQVASALKRAVMKRAKGSIAARIRVVRCPKHGSTPTVVCQGRSPESMSFKVSGCCDELLAKVKAALK